LHSERERKGVIIADDFRIAAAILAGFTLHISTSEAAPLFFHSYIYFIYNLFSKL
jgi:hypothetical protein